MKRKLFRADIIFFSLFVISAVFTLLQLSGRYNPLTRFDTSPPKNERQEEYEASLSRIKSVRKLEVYSDSLYNATYSQINKEADYEKKYSNLLAAIVRKRFYHGYSEYGFSDNYLLTLFAKITNAAYNSVIAPDDVLKYAYASCSQQSVVMMELLNRKNISTRKVGFLGKKFGGHFSFEAYYNGQWHFFDTNMEPDLAVLNAYDRPGISFLTQHTELLTTAYRRYNADKILDIFPKYAYGTVNVFPAPRGLLFQKITGILSYSLWFFFFILFIITRRLYKRQTVSNYVWNRRIHFPPFFAGAPSVSHPGHKASGA